MSPAGRGTLAWVPRLTLVLFLGPLALGLAFTVLPAWGYLPVLGGHGLSLAPWRALLAAPGLGHALAISVLSGAGAALIALALTLGFAAAWQPSALFARIQRLLAPLLALPHAAFAIGFAFLVAPEGWLVRLASPWATGWTRPPDLVLVQDPAGLALMAGLAIKEVPFLLLMLLAALEQVPAGPVLLSARTMGYGRAVAWLKTVLPLVWPQLRLPFYAVLAYSLSVVDMALVLGPATPPSLAVLVLRWFDDPDLAKRFLAACGATVQLVLAIGALGLARLAEPVFGCCLRPWLSAGGRGLRLDRPLRLASAVGMVGVLAVQAAALLVLALWSIAGQWRFPAAWPGSWSLDSWRRALPLLAAPAGHTLVAGLAASAIALALVLGCLEHEQRARLRPGTGALWLLYLPLLVPQAGFLFGVAVLLVWLGLDGSWPALVWSHLLFVLPYVFLALAQPYRTLDERYARTAAGLGAGPWRVFWRVKLPLLRPAVLTAAAIGFAVSVAQYLPTVLAGAGRLPTLTTEAVALAAGADRRAIAATAFAQMALPLIGFALALLPGRGRR